MCSRERGRKSTIMESHVILGVCFQLKARFQAGKANGPTKIVRNANMKLNDGAQDMTGKSGSEQKVKDIGNGASEITAGGGVSVGGVIPIPIPGTDGGFQFQLGPIGFGGNWGFGIVPPGSVISYSQPIVVSPYSPPSSATPSPYTPPSGTPSPPFANVQPYQQQQPIPSLPQYYLPYPVGSNVQGSFGSYVPYPSVQYGQAASLNINPPNHRKFPTTSPDHN